MDGSSRIKRKPAAALMPYPLLEKLSKTKTRNGGPTSGLQIKSQKNRNALVHKPVQFTSFNDVKSYVVYLCERDPDLVTSAINETELDQDIVSQLDKSCPRHISVHDSAELILGRKRLTQREYIAETKALMKGNVHLAKYIDDVKYASEMDVGSVDFHKCHEHDPNVSDGNMDCMCATTKFGDTLQRTVATDALFSKFQFPRIEQQIQLFEHLKKERNSLYKGLDADKRTLFLSETGDNFRAGVANLPSNCHFQFSI